MKHCKFLVLVLSLTSLSLISGAEECTFSTHPPTPCSKVLGNLLAGSQNSRLKTRALTRATFAITKHKTQTRDGHATSFLIRNAWLYDQERKCTESIVVDICGKEPKSSAITVDQSFYFSPSYASPAVTHPLERDKIDSTDYVVVPHKVSLEDRSFLMGSISHLKDSIAQQALETEQLRSFVDKQTIPVQDHESFVGARYFAALNKLSVVNYNHRTQQGSLVLYATELADQ